MGLESRDYARDGSYSRRSSDGGFLDETPAVKWLLIITVVVFLLQMFIQSEVRFSDEELAEKIRTYYVPEGASRDEREAIVEEMIRVIPDGAPVSPEFYEQMPPELYELISRAGLSRSMKVSTVEEWFKLDTNKVIYAAQVWRLLSCAFLHHQFGIYHILINMLLLYWFGRPLESMLGSKEFLIFYLVSAIVASLAYVGLQLWTGDRFPALGASGAVMAVMCLYTMWYPRHKIFFMFFVRMEMRILLLIYVIYDLHPILLQLSGNAIYTGVGHAAHLGGLAFGYLYYRNNWQLSRMWDATSRKLKPRANVRVYDPPANAGVTNSEAEPPRPQTKSDERFEEMIDLVLEKISTRGEESLTEGERKLLIRASQRYRDRQ